MKPFQVNCSELIADFNIENDEDIRNIIMLLMKEYEVNIYFEVIIEDKEFYFDNNANFKVQYENILFNISVATGKYDETWSIKIEEQNNIEAIIKSIDKCTRIVYEEDTVEASNLIIRGLIREIVKKLPNYSSIIEKIKNGLDLDSIFEVKIKLGSGNNITTLCYGCNGYDETLGWYFDSLGHYDSKNYPFFEWAERECRGEIKAYDGGSSYGYDEFVNNAERERLGEKK